MVDKALFSSEKQDWETPQWLFDELNKEFGFDVDVCAEQINAKCQQFWSPLTNGLIQSWHEWGICWCNPPYGREIERWVRKACLEALSGATVVMLLPARTDTRWFHDYIYNRAKIRFLRGRLKFGGAKNSAPFPSMVVVFRP